MLRKVNTNYKTLSNILFILKIIFQWSKALASCQPDCWTPRFLNYNNLLIFIKYQVSEIYLQQQKPDKVTQYKEVTCKSIPILGDTHG